MYLRQNIYMPRNYANIMEVNDHLNLFLLFICLKVSTQKNIFVCFHIFYSETLVKQSFATIIIAFYLKCLFYGTLSVITNYAVMNVNIVNSFNFCLHLFAVSLLICYEFV